MVVRIRLARFGRKRQPFYNIVVAQARSARNSKPLEVLGTYDPIPKVNLSGHGKFKEIKLDTPRTRYWLGVGAQPSDPAWRILSLAGLIEKKYRPGESTTPVQAEGTEPLQSPVETEVDVLAEELEGVDLSREERNGLKE